MNRQDFNYSCNAYEYQVQYKGQNIGGCGTIGREKVHYRIAKSNINMYSRYAEIDIENILNGKGRPDMLKVIERIGQ